MEYLINNYSQIINIINIIGFLYFFIRYIFYWVMGRLMNKILYSSYLDNEKLLINKHSNSSGDDIFCYFIIIVDGYFRIRINKDKPNDYMIYIPVKEISMWDSLKIIWNHLGSILIHKIYKIPIKVIPIKFTKKTKEAIYRHTQPLTHFKEKLVCNS